MEEQKTLRLSVSRVDLFKTCKAKYYYKYLEKLPEPSSYHLATGSFVHKILEEFHKLKPSTSDFRSAASEAYKIAKRDEDLQKIVDAEIMAEGKDWIKNYVLLLEKNGGPNVLHVEEPFTFSLEAGLSVMGYIDRVDQLDTNKLLIVDYKTSKSTRYLKPFQLQTYAYAMKLKYPEASISAAYEMVRDNFSRMNVEIIENEFDNVLNSFRSVGLEIQQLTKEKPTTPWPASPTSLCNFCAFRDRCEEDRLPSIWKI